MYRTHNQKKPAAPATATHLGVQKEKGCEKDATAAAAVSAGHTKPDEPALPATSTSFFYRSSSFSSSLAVFLTRLFIRHRHL